MNTRLDSALRSARRVKFPKRKRTRDGATHFVNRLVVYLSPAERHALDLFCEEEGVSRSLAVRAFIRMSLDVEEDS